MSTKSQPKTGETIAAQNNRARHLLLQSALRLLRTKGPGALTVRNITADVGYSTSAVYTHFGGKHGLVEALYLEGILSFNTAVCTGLSDSLLQGASAYREWALSNPDHYMVIFGRAIPDFEPSEESARQGWKSFDLLVDVVTQAGAINPGSAAYHVWATIHGYVMFELSGLAFTPSQDAAQSFQRAVANFEASLATY